MSRTIRTISIVLCTVIATIALADGTPGMNAAGRKEQPVPTGHEVGKDDAAKDEAERDAGVHYAGEDCGICHTPGGKAGKRVFTMSGTLYTDRFGSLPLAGAEIILQDVRGNLLSMTTNAAGNFWTDAPIASNPTTVASHGGVTEQLYQRAPDGTLTPTDSADSRSWLYKAWIKNGDQVLSMITVAPVGGSTGTTPRMSCGMHHSPTGSTGAAWVTRAPALTSYPTTELSFKKHVQPILQSKCAPCHVPGERMTRLVTESDITGNKPTSIDYSGGHDFTSYAGSSVKVGSGDTAKVLEKDGVVDATDPDYPDDSKILVAPKIRKPGRKVEHPGGGFWTPDDPDYRAIRQWIAEGAKDN